MGVELIRKAVCDRCGRECSHIKEKTLHEDVAEQYDVKIKQFKTIAYHYTEMALRSFDSRFGDSTETAFVLCGHCVSELGEWLKNKEIEGERE